jgi:hypothetical protein
MRTGWIALVAALVLGAGVVGWLLGGGGGGRGQPSGGDETVGAGGAVGGTATATPEVTVRQTMEPTASPTPTIEPTPRPTIEPTPRPTIEPTPQLVGLVIDFPADGETVRSRSINIIGTAPPGATVTRDIPLWFDDHTIAGDDGLWMLPVELAEGQNRLALRLGDDPSTAQVLLVTYQPAP